jgi:FkbM family methyltransferase
MPGLGRAMVRAGLGRLPEETTPPSEMRAAGVPAIAMLEQYDTTQNRPSSAHSRPSGNPEPLAGRDAAPLSDAWRTLRGVTRSLRIYYGDRAHRVAMDKLYAQFVRPGDLVFDIGAHVGDRVGAFRRLGARVVAVEPQPALVRTLKLLYGRDRTIVIAPVAVGARAGRIALRLNLDNPTVSSASDAFIRAAADARGWEGQTWTRTVEVPLTTLDALIAHHGLPSFVKLDVEGFEAQALAGLTQPVPALSFEFTTIQRDVAAQCVRRCMTLGYTRFDAALGESHTLIHAGGLSGAQLLDWIVALPPEANSGDIYARLA